MWTLALFVETVSGMSVWYRVRGESILHGLLAARIPAEVSGVTISIGDSNPQDGDSIRRVRLTDDDADCVLSDGPTEFLRVEDQFNYREDEIVALVIGALVQLGFGESKRCSREDGIGGEFIWFERVA
jgi:hypothetical protein